MVLPWPPKAHCDLQHCEDIGKQKLRQTHHELDSISIVSTPHHWHHYIHKLRILREIGLSELTPKGMTIFISKLCFHRLSLLGPLALGKGWRVAWLRWALDHTYEANYVSRKTRAQWSHLPGVLVRLGISKDHVSQCLPFIATGNGKTTNCLRSLFLQCPMTFKSVFPQISSLTWDWHHRTMSALGSNTLGSTLASITSFLRWRSTKSTNSGVEQSKLDRKSGNCAMKSNKHMSCAVHCDIVHKSFAKIHKWHLLDENIRQSKNQALRRGRCWHGQILHWAATARLWEHLRVGTWN